MTTENVTIIYPTLTEQIDSEPLNAARTDQQVLDWEDEVLLFAQDLDYTDFAIWMIQNGISAKLEESVYRETEFRVANPPVTPGDPPNSFWTQPVWNGILTTQVLLSAGADMALGKSEIRAMITTISGPNLPLTNADKQALFDLSDVPGVRWGTQTQFGEMDDVSKLSKIAEARI